MEKLADAQVKTSLSIVEFTGYHKESERRINNIEEEYKELKDIQIDNGKVIVRLNSAVEVLENSRKNKMAIIGAVISGIIIVFASVFLTLAVSKKPDTLQKLQKVQKVQKVL